MASPADGVCWQNDELNFVNILYWQAGVCLVVDVERWHCDWYTLHVIVSDETDITDDDFRYTNIRKQVWQCYFSSDSNFSFSFYIILR